MHCPCSCCHRSRRSRVASASASRPAAPGHAGRAAGRAPRRRSPPARAAAARRWRPSSLPPWIDGPAAVAGDQPIDLDLLRRVVDRHVRVVLEEARLADAVAADPAGGQVGDAARREPQPRVGDVGRAASARSRRPPRSTTTSDRTDGQQQIEVVNHQVEDDVDVEAALGKRAEPVHLDEARVDDERQRRRDRRIEPLGMAGGQHDAARARPRRSGGRPRRATARSASRPAPRTPRSMNGSATSTCDTVGTAIVTASTRPTQSPRSRRSAVVAVLRGDLRGAAGFVSTTPTSSTSVIAASSRA